MTKRHRELDLERKWELYRLDVVEGMPDSAYKTAVLAGIAHKLKMLDRMEALSRIGVCGSPISSGGRFVSC